MFTGDGVGNESQGLGFGNGLTEICNGHPVKLGSGRQQITFVDCLQAHESLTGVGVGRRFQSECLFDLFHGDEVSFEKQDEQFFSRLPVEIRSGEEASAPFWLGPDASCAFRRSLRSRLVRAIGPPRNGRTAGPHGGCGAARRERRATSVVWSPCRDRGAAAVLLIRQISMMNSRVDRPTQLQIWALATQLVGSEGDENDAPSRYRPLSVAF